MESPELSRDFEEAFAPSPNLVSSGLLVEISTMTQPLARGRCQRWRFEFEPSALHCVIIASFDVYNIYIYNSIYIYIYTIIYIICSRQTDLKCPLSRHWSLRGEMLTEDDFGTSSRLYVSCSCKFHGKGQDHSAGPRDFLQSRGFSDIAPGLHISYRKRTLNNTKSTCPMEVAPRKLTQNKQWLTFWYILPSRRNLHEFTLW